MSGKGANHLAFLAACRDPRKIRFGFDVVVAATIRRRNPPAPRTLAIRHCGAQATSGNGETGGTQQTHERFADAEQARAVSEEHLVIARQ